MGEPVTLSLAELRGFEMMAQVAVEENAADAVARNWQRTLRHVRWLEAERVRLREALLYAQGIAEGLAERLKDARVKETPRG